MPPTNWGTTPDEATVCLGLVHHCRYCQRGTPGADGQTMTHDASQHTPAPFDPASAPAPVPDDPFEGLTTAWG